MHNRCTVPLSKTLPKILYRTASFCYFYNLFSQLSFNRNFYFTSFIYDIFLLYCNAKCMHSNDYFYIASINYKSLCEQFFFNNYGSSKLFNPNSIGGKIRVIYNPGVKYSLIVLGGWVDKFVFVSFMPILCVQEVLTHFTQYFIKWTKTSWTYSMVGSPCWRQQRCESESYLFFFTFFL